MKDLANFILENIIEKGSFSVDEKQDNDRMVIEIKANPTVIGLIIGKGGNTIKAIQTLLRVRGRLQNQLVNVTVTDAN